jgi:hypothetical protein
MCPDRAVRQSTTGILDAFRDVPGCLSRILDRVPESLGAALGWCALKIWKACRIEEVKEWK